MGGDVQIEVYKCPSCGGAVAFDADAGCLTCAWCGNAYDEKDLEVKRANDSLAGYLCPECGAKLMLDDFIAADTCPYCGNSEVVPHRFERGCVCAGVHDPIHPVQARSNRAV
ncbi:MAG: hypothetical protein Q4A07_04565 [Coriobacteriales bacterium]|nr:hypothetical protein [Coriobacteriales bacterium]